MHIRKVKDAGQTASPYYRSKIFKQLFLSYLLLILAFLGIYAGWYLYSFRTAYRERIAEYHQQQTAAFGTAMDRQMLMAQALCASVNTSENCRNVLQTAYVEKKTIDSMQLYKLLNELTRIKTSANNLNVYSLMLGFFGDSKLYTPTSVLSVANKVTTLDAYPMIRRCSVSELLNTGTEASLALNKDYIIYADRYSGFGATASARGMILILMEPSGFAKLASDKVPAACGLLLRQDGDTLLAQGVESPLQFCVDSLVVEGLSYSVFLPESLLEPQFEPVSLLPLLLVLLLGIVFAAVTFQLAKRYYQPINNISRMMEHHPDSKDEFDGILTGIRDLIGERNGYREKMVTISPYAQQGMLHSIINGGADDPRLRVLINEQFVELRKPCFMLALVNLANVTAREVPSAKYRDAAALIAHVCAELSTEEISVVSTVHDPQNLYVIVSGDDTPALEDMFYRLYDAIVEALDDPGFAVTIGVSRREDDIEQLETACRHAEHALCMMMTGGRSSVYFDAAAAPQEDRSFFFPKDAHRRMLHAFRERSLTDLIDLLNEIYQQNVVQADLSPTALEAMVDELHLTIGSALRESFDVSTTHIQIRRVPMPATIEEIMAYYRHVFETVLCEPIVPPEDTGSSIEEEVCTYISDNLYNPDLSQNAVADRFGLSSKTIGAICKNRFGATFLQYVRDRQIQRAVELLQTSDAPLEQIAQQCGFSNLLTFRRNFKAVMNMNPSDFRK